MDGHLECLDDLNESVENQREALGDQVFDILGTVLTGQDLQGLLSRAISGQDGGSAQAVVEEKLGQDLEAEVARRQSAISDLTDEDLARLRGVLAESQVRSLQGRVVEDFVTEAMQRLGGDIRLLGDGRSRVGYVPDPVRARAEQAGRPVERRYPLLAFHRDGIEALPSSVLRAQLALKSSG